MGRGWAPSTTPGCWILSLVLLINVSADDCPAGCNGHGQCLEGDVCLCERGWFGADCSGSLSGWATMHKFEHNFYEHDAFKSRYVISAHHLRHCRNIVEVGAYRTPITHFLTSQHESVTVIDPYIQPMVADTLNGERCQVRHLPMLFEDFKLTGKEDCFVYMGLDYYNEDHTNICEDLKAVVHKFQTVIIDYAAKYPTGAKCFQALDLPSAFDRVANVVMELEGNDWPDLKGSWHPTGLTTRVLYVLRHRNATKDINEGAKFLKPSEYSGAGAAEDAALPTVSKDKHSDNGVSQLFERAGTVVRTEEDAREVRGWQLKGLVDKAEPSAGVTTDPRTLPQVSDNYQAVQQHAAKKEWAAATEYWTRHLQVQGQAHVAQYFDYGMQLYNAHKYMEAAELLHKVTEIAVGDPRGYNNLALAYESAGKIAEARRILQEGLSYDPNHNGLNFNFAKILLDEDNFEGAASHLVKAAQVDQGNADIHFYLGISLRKAGRLQESEMAFSRVQELNPHYVFRYINTDTNDQYWTFVEDEKVLLSQLAGAPGTCNTTVHSHCALRDIVLELRALETTLGFIGDRQYDGRKVQLQTGYMKHSFAYGSTFYQSWMKVFNNDVLQEAVQKAKRNNKVYGVLGSSIGWHVFYGGLTWELRSRGWEILCSQVEIAKGMQEKHLRSKESHDLVSFQCLDALQADLTDVAVLILAFSRDVNLGAVLNNKLAAELEQGALVISWSRILDAQPEFERAAVYKVAVSWSQDWGMYVYRRK